MLQAELPSYMVPAVISVLDKMPINANGKVDRRALAKSAQMATASKALSERVPPRNDVERAVCEEFADALGSEVGITDSFFDLGGHSLMATRVVSRIKKRLDVGVTVADIFECPVVADLADKISPSLWSNISSAECSNTPSNPEQENASRLPPETIRLQSRHTHSTASVEEPMKDIQTLIWNLPASGYARPTNPAEYSREVFLTGATGYLGTALMQQLLQHKHVRRIHVLVRARSVEDAKKRITKSATVAGWWHGKYRHRISYWLGDLRKPCLGLTDSQWRKLSGFGDPNERVDGIVHNGAKINMYSSYDTLRAANVISTYQLLKLSGTSPCLKRFVFVSTAPSLDFDCSSDAESALRNVLGAANGYLRSKLVAERMLWQTTLLEHFPYHRVVILKPGFIIGNAVSGIANVDDFLWRIVAGSISIGCFPEEPDSSWLYISSYDNLASIATESLCGSEEDRLEKREASGLPTKRFWEAVNAALPTPLLAKPMKNWRDEIKSRTGELGPQHPILAVLHFVTEGGQVLGGQVLGDVSGSEKRHLRDYQAEYDAGLETAVTCNVRYLFNIGYFSTSWTWERKDDVFSRALV